MVRYLYSLDIGNTGFMYQTSILLTPLHHKIVKPGYKLFPQLLNILVKQHNKILILMILLLFYILGYC